MSTLKNKIEQNRFITQTALDYDMSVFQVNVFYDKWYDKGLFYQKLEEYINSRKKSLL